LGELGVDGRITGCEDLDWIYLAQDMVQWWAVVSMATNLQVL
jgi:hypothetical protein